MPLTRLSLCAALLAACSAGETVGVEPDAEAPADAVDVASRDEGAPAVDAPPDASLDASAALDAAPATDAVVPGDVGADGPREAAADAPPRADVAASDAAPMYPAYLRDGRTYDQERDYVAWDGAVGYVSLRHRDGTALPPSEGGASCSAGCTEQVTRIAAGGRVRGRFSYVQSFSVQVAATAEAGAGDAVIEVCGVALPTVATQVTSSSTPGFANHPQPAFAVPTAGECAWSVRAERGYVDLRAVTVQFRGGGAPTVDLRVDGSNGPASYDAPASYLLSWTSTSASRCVAAGSWSGARDITGAARLAGIPTGTYSYAITCENGAGTATDAVTVYVRQPPG